MATCEISLVDLGDSILNSAASFQTWGELPLWKGGDYGLGDESNGHRVAQDVQDSGVGRIKPNTSAGSASGHEQNAAWEESDHIRHKIPRPILVVRRRQGHPNKLSV